MSWESQYSDSFVLLPIWLFRLPRLAGNRNRDHSVIMIVTNGERVDECHELIKFGG